MPTQNGYQVRKHFNNNRSVVLTHTLHLLCGGPHFSLLRLAELLELLAAAPAHPGAARAPAPRPRWPRLRRRLPSRSVPREI